VHQVHNLTSEQLAAREVEIIDIASISRDYWSKVIGAPNVDLTTFKSQRTERGPLLKGWMVWSNTDFSISIYANAQWTMLPFRSLVLLLSSDISRYHTYACTCCSLCRIHAFRWWPHTSWWSWMPLYGASANGSKIASLRYADISRPADRLAFSEW